MNKYQREQTLSMSHDIRKHLVGQFGENLANRWFQQNGYEVKVNALIFDDTKDFTVTPLNGSNDAAGPAETVEVKTMSLFYKHRAFFFPLNQIQKLSTVDHLIIVQTPHPFGSLENSIILFGVPKSQRTIDILEQSLRIPGRAGSEDNFSIPRAVCEKLGEITRESAPAIYDEAVILPPREDKYQYCDAMQNYFNDLDSLSELPV